MARQRHIRELECLRFVYRKDGLPKQHEFPITGKNDLEREASLRAAQSKVMKFVLGNDNVEYSVTSFQWRD